MNSICIFESEDANDRISNFSQPILWPLAANLNTRNCQSYVIVGRMKVPSQEMQLLASFYIFNIEYCNAKSILSFLETTVLSMTENDIQLAIRVTALFNDLS
jgi:hypothetical protein